MRLSPAASFTKAIAAHLRRTAQAELHEALDSLGYGAGASHHRERDRER